MADCLISSVKEIGKCIWDSFLKGHVDYWWSFDDNIQQLRDGIRKLEWQTLDIQQKIEVARNNAEIVRPGVQEWLNSSNDKLEEAKTTFPNDNTPEAWKLISRYSVGKNAKETAEEIAKLLNDGDFIQIADPAPPPARRFTALRSTMYFESRKHIEEEIIDSLKQSSVGIIGICGMGGVGKTTMAERIGMRVKEGKQFEEVVMVTVSHKIDMGKIQNEIAEKLGLNFRGNSMDVRADELSRRLMDDKSKIIILDDVWESIRFEHLGIPIESNFKGCKVIFTSRSRETCKTIKNKKVFELKILDEKEAWILFKNKAGHCVEDLDLHPWAKAIVAECKGLPLALVTVGQALQNETEERIWKYSLSKLKEAKPTDLPEEIMTHVYGSLELSYEKLRNDLEKKFFLLCCLFPEDYNIRLEELAWYCMGLQMFDDISIEEATVKTHVLVGKLKTRYLLIDGLDKLHVKMHDVVRDVAIYIGSKEGFLKSLSSIKNSSDDNCNWMSVNISNERMEVPVVLRFPKLQLLMWSSKSFYDISHLSFVGMEDLKVLSFEDISIGSLPTTLESLTHLQTLRLRDCKVENISVIGKLTGLKILSCYRCENITELPAEIWRLSGLRLLELFKCKLLQRIPFGVISCLRRLEELKMRGSFSRWEAEENGKEKRNASLRELECLHNLSCLEIDIDDCTLSSQEICLSQNLVKYFIRIGDVLSYWYDYEVRDNEKVMFLNLGSDIGAVGKWIQEAVRNSEGLYLKGDGSVSNILNIAEIKHLRNLVVEKCSTLKKLVKFGTVFRSLETLTLEDVGNLQEICHLNQKVFSDVSFSNLKSINIRECHNLRYLFSVSVATTCLPQLEDLDIQECDSMEHVFWNEIRDDNTYDYIELPKLEYLRLHDLPKLNSISPLDVSFSNLKSIDIEECHNLRYLFSVSVATTCLLQLEVLRIENCDSMENVFWNEIRHDNSYGCIDLPMLEKLTLCNLRNFTAFWQGLINFPTLKELKIGGLPSLKYSVFPLSSEIPCSLKSIKISSSSNLKHLFSASVATTILSQLEVLRIKDCEAMEGVFWNDGKEDYPDGCIEFTKLKKLSLYDLPNFTSFCQGLENIIINFPNLTEMIIGGGLLKLNSMCPLNSERVVGDDQNTSLHFVCNPKFEMGSLKELTIYKFGDDIRNIWCHQIPDNIFNNLERLEISSIRGIRSLMSTSIAKNLISLKDLSIVICEEMTEVIERDDDDKQVVDHINILFPSLRVLTMWELPKLKRFWQWNHPLQLPLLEIVSIRNCPMMETFTLGSINTPNITAILIKSATIVDQKNINEVIRHIWIESQRHGNENKNEDTDKSEDEYEDTKNEDTDKSEDEYEDTDKSERECNNENVNKDET